MSNKIFLDSSTQNRVITVTGNGVAQCSKCPNPPASGVEYNSALHGASVYLKGGANNYVATSMADGSLNIGTGDFTMSCWVYPLSAAASWGNTIFRWAGWNIYRYTSGGGISWGHDSFGVSSTPSNTCPLFTWTHFAYSRVSGTGRLFINGNLMTTFSDGNNYNASDEFGVGKYGTVNNWDGFISGVHVVIGTGLYTANFTPEVVPTAVANTKLLLKFANIGVGDSTTKTPLITMGSVERSTTQKKYGSYSIYFPGTVSDYVYVPSGINSEFSMGAGNFTLEMWVRPEGLAGTTRVIAQVGNPFFNIHINSSNRFAFSINDASIIADSTITITYGQWYHLSLVRSNGTYYFFIDGILKVTSTDQGTLNITTSQLYLGRFSSSALYPFYGYIDDLRILKNVAKYTANFTPPLELSRV